MNSHYLLEEAREHALAATKIIEELQAGSEEIDSDLLDRAIRRLSQAMQLLQDESVDFEVGETDD